MTKKEVIIRIHLAKAAHMRWRNIAQISIGGLSNEVNKVSIPILQTESEFGKWYYGDGMALSMLPSYMAIEEPLENVFNTYIQIFTLMRAKKKSSGLFGWGGEAKKKAEMDNLVANFSNHNKFLLDSIHQLELEVMNLSDSDFSQLVNLD
jgi:hypothetical protein